MKTKVLLFGITREILGGNTYEADLLPGGTVGQLKSMLVERFPKLEGLASLMVAVNNEYAKDEQPIGPNDEVALIPPVSGG